MFTHRFSVKHFFLLLLTIKLTLGQEPLVKPKFPNVLQVEVQGIFQEEKAEVDASLYYDMPGNRAVLTYTYQNETTTSIFNFNDNQLTYIKGFDCSVSEIKEDSQIFFQFKVDKVTKKKTIGTPEEIFFFTSSELDRQELSIFPSYIYTATMDIPQYLLKNCDVTHIFSKPELELPDCEGHACRPTLVSISVKCPPPTEEDTEIFHIYNFFRFRSSIKDESVFQPPVGVHCNVKGDEPFPQFPLYFSLTYNLVEEKKDTYNSEGVFTDYKKVWYDSKLRLIRIDEFDDEGALISSRIFDFYGKVAYTIVASLPICQSNDLEENLPLDTMTQLPKLLFTKSPEERKDVIYIGKRSVHGLVCDVWTQSIFDEATDAKIVLEYYYTNNIEKGEEMKSALQLSHVDIYTYEKDSVTREYYLSLQKFLTISNFRTKPKEWEAFDISSCFSGDGKKGFSLKVEGPPIVKHSHMYEEILEKLYMKLIILTNASVIRISQLKGEFDGINIATFNGWILNKVQPKKSKVENKEPDMEETFNLIEKAANDGKLSIKVKKNGEDQVYKITSVTEKVTSCGSCISGGTLAAVGVVLLFMGITFGFVGYYVFLKKRFAPNRDDKIRLEATS